MLSTKSVSDHRVILAVDAFPDDIEIEVHAGEGARFFLERLAADVEPVFVYRPVPPGLFIPEELNADRPWELIGQENVKAVAKMAGLSRIEQPKLLNASGPSVKAMVKSVIDHALATGAEMIAVGSHSRKGLSRLLMGSFAEELVLNSPIPVLVTPKKVHFTELSHFNTLLFPTDFGEASRETFEEVVKLASSLGVELVIVHQIQLFEASFPDPFLIPTVGAEAFHNLAEVADATGKKWQQEAEAKGVKTEFKLMKQLDDASHVIISTAHGYPGCVIVMASHAGLLESKLWGSHTRDVLRGASCPVLVLHAPA